MRVPFVCRVLGAIFLSVRGGPRPKQLPGSFLPRPLQAGPHLGIVDPASLKVVAKCPSATIRTRSIASTDGTTAYVSNYGFGSFNTLAVVDLVRSVDCRDRPGRAARPARTHLRRRQDLVHCRGREGDRPLRSRDAQSGLDPGHRAEPHPHDLRLR